MPSTLPIDFAAPKFRIKMPDGSPVALRGDQFCA
jgi:hypothetical protein